MFFSGKLQLVQYFVWCMFLAFVCQNFNSCPIMLNACPSKLQSCLLSFAATIIQPTGTQIDFSGFVNLDIFLCRGVSSQPFGIVLRGTQTYFIGFVILDWFLCRGVSSQPLGIVLRGTQTDVIVLLILSCFWKGVFQET